MALNFIPGHGPTFSLDGNVIGSVIGSAVLIAVGIMVT